MALRASWELCLCAVAFFIFSIILSNAVAWIQQFGQERRIVRKTKALSKTNRSSYSVANENDNITKGENGVIPVTILTGFLGAGKTTLVNSILSSPDHGYKIMILVNEVGAVSIDHHLIANAPRDNIVIMKNGCMCCTVRSSSFTSNYNGSMGKNRNDELERLLDHLLEVTHMQSTPHMDDAGADTDANAHDDINFDYLLVETSGLADPGPIVQTFLEMHRASRFRLDGVITLVDTPYFLSYSDRNMPVEMQAQLVYADVIVMNKIDLLDDFSVFNSEYESSMLELECKSESNVSLARLPQPIKEVRASYIYMCHSQHAKRLLFS
jgi:Ni2+-binding GTPase involved in maturation of urease and hydrogenase